MRLITCTAKVVPEPTKLSTPKIPSPPPTYDHKKQLLGPSKALISENWPELTDLVDTGILLAVPRPSTYKERRTDGYLEPELILLVGTAHLSKQSSEDVKRVVRATQPQNVVVELCKSRSAQLYQPDEVSQSGRSSALSSTSEAKISNPLGLSGGSLLESFQRSVALGGRSALLLRLLLGNLSSKLSAEIGINSGTEFRAAREAADEIGAQIVLGDRPIEVTLRRAWEGLPTASKWRLLSELAEGVRGAQGAGALAAAQAVEQLKDDDAVSVMLSSLADRYPEALPPLVHERDLYFAWSLKRSKAVNGTNTVVGVVGKGHVRGVCYALTHDSGQLRFRDLAGSRKSKNDAKKAIVQFVVETAVIGAAIYAWQEYSHGGSSIHLF